jgi:hypothetical protein
VSFVAPVPVLGTGLRWGITPNIYVLGNVAGIYAGEYASYIDGSVEVGYDFNRNFGMFVGFRYYAMDLEWDGDEYDVDNQAVYAGVEVRL